MSEEQNQKETIEWSRDLVWVMEHPTGPLVARLRGGIRLELEEYISATSVLRRDSHVRVRVCFPSPVAHDVTEERVANGNILSVVVDGLLAEARRNIVL